MAGAPAKRPGDADRGAVARLTDRVVAALSPRAGVHREMARRTLRILAAERAHEASSPSVLRKFHREGPGPNGIVQQGAAALRAQARHMERNNDIARGILKTLVNNVVGPQGVGIEPQPRRADGSIHEPYAALLRELYRDWCQRPEVTWLHPWPSTQRMLATAWLRDGESFAQELMGPVPYLQHGTRVPYSLELFEADLVPLDYDDGERIRQGVERNAWGRPINYWVYKSHPLEPGGAVMLSRADLKPIGADRVIHLARRDRIGQVRGISEFASIIARLEDIKDYEQSERIAAKVAASLTAYVKRGSGEDFASEVVERDADGNIKPRDLRLSPGTILDTLNPGEEVGLIDSKRPNPNVMTFRQGQLKAVAAGVGASYSSIARSYDGTFSAQRQELVEQWIHYATLTDEFTGQLVRPVWASFVRAAALSGLAPVPADVVAGTEDDALFIAQAMPWIDPMKEAQAMVTLVRAGFASEVEVMRRRGVNPRDMLEQVTRWRDEANRRGLVFTSDGAHPINGASQAADPQAANDPAQSADGGGA